jgi:cell division protein FtsI (penicillin-binding protein 3)
MADEYYHNQPKKFYDHLHALKLDTTSGIDIVGAAKPFIKKPSSKYWGKTTIPFMAHGYEELETPLNLLMVYNAIANNGTMMKPYLVNSVNEMGEELKVFKPQVLVNKICSEATLGKLKSCLLEVVQNPIGTGYQLKSDLYKSAGKTGTAVTAMDNRGYNKGSKIYQSAFIGYFPADNPEYSIAVVIQNSRESKHVYGASVSGPVFKEIADRLYATRVSDKTIHQFQSIHDNNIYQFYGMKKDLNNIFNEFKYKETDSATSGNWRIAMVQDGNAKLLADNISVKSGKVPDVTGMGLKDALYLLENMGLKVSASGSGKVIYQSLAQNTDFKKGQQIKLRLD